MASKSPEELIEEGLDLALSHFRETKYHEALNIYNKVLVIMKVRSKVEIINSREKRGLTSYPSVGPLVHPKLCSAIDQRAATYEKLNLLQNALQDGKKMIEYEPAGCKGYLRVGKVLLLMKREGEAHRIYRRGLQTIRDAIAKHQVQPPQKLYDQLKKQYKSTVYITLEVNDPKLSFSKASSLIMSKTVHEKDHIRSNRVLVQSLLPTKRALKDTIATTITTKSKRKVPEKITTDPLNYLPTEILVKIFKNLSLSEVLQATMVAKRWSSLLTSIPMLFKSITFKSGISSSDFLKGMKQLVNAHKFSNGKQIDSIKLRPKSSDEKSCLSTLLYNVDLNYNKVELILDEMNLVCLLKLIFGESDAGTIKNFQQTQCLRISIKFVPKYESYLLKLLPNLEFLEIIPSKIMCPKVDSELQIFETASTFPKLSTLSLLGKPANEHSSNIPFASFFGRNQFPNLRSLSIIGYDFSLSIVRPEFQVMFDNMSQLKSLQLEGNTGLTLEIFLNVFQFSSCRLNHLMFREVNGSSLPIHLRQFQVENLVPLSQLKSLDIYACAVTFEGLKKLLSCSSSTLQLLSVGNCPNIFFKTSKIFHQRNVRGGFFDFKEFLSLVPNVQKLYLNEYGIDNFTLKDFYNNLKSLNFVSKLAVLDLSFCHFDGIGLLDLFSVSKRHPPTFKLSKLIIDGIDIASSTIKLLEIDGYVTKVHSDPKKLKWREYGVNSLIP